MTVETALFVRINGEPHRLSGVTTIADMVREFGLDPARVAVERNLEVVPRAMLGQVRVEDGDVYEIVRFVGGG